MGTKIRRMTPQDWDAVKEIYVQGLATGDATFETAAPTWEVWDGSHLAFARLVATSEDNTEVKGWAALSPTSTRSVYGGVAEVSLYVGNDFRGQGLGRELLNWLIDESEKHGIWTLQASVFPENRASLALHQSCEFRQVGIRERIGQMKGLWRDTILLERRSKIVGSEGRHGDTETRRHGDAE